MACPKLKSIAPWLFDPDELAGQFETPACWLRPGSHRPSLWHVGISIDRSACLAGAVQHPLLRKHWIARRILARQEAAAFQLSSRSQRWEGRGAECRRIGRREAMFTGGPVL